MNALQNQQAKQLEHVLIGGDLASLSPEQRVNYYKAVCESVGLNHLTKPFEYIKLNGKLTLYARKDATDQLRKVHGVSITKLEQSITDGLVTVIAYARDKDGKEDSDMGAVNIAGLKGENLANALMKCSTKAKRRVTLSICGLGLLDETEIETVPRDVTENTPGQLSAKMQHEREAVEVDPSLYSITFGKWKGKQIKDVDMYELADYVRYIEKSAEEQGKAIQGKVLEFMEHAQKFLDSRAESPAAIDEEIVL